MTCLLSIEGLRGGYADADVLHGVELELNEGEIVAIVGPNGAGKSTVLNAIMNLIRIREGDIRFRGKSILNLPTEDFLSMGISYVPQVRNVFPSLSVHENLLLGTPRKADLGRRLEEILHLFPNLEPRLKMRAGALSGGERQMLAFARGLMSRPSLLLLDEPSAALSPLLAATVFDKIREIHRTGTTMLIVEQNVRRILEISDRGYVLESGKNALSGVSRELLNDPRMGQLYLGGP